MSLFAAALEAQDGVSSCSTKSVDDCKPSALCQDDEATGHTSTAAVGDDDEAAGHNSTVTIGEAVPAYRFMAWLVGEPGLLGMEDRSFLRGDVDDLVDHEDNEDDNLSFLSGESNSTEHFNLPPLPTSGHPIDVQDTAPEYIHRYQAAKFKDITVDATLHDSQEELMHHIKKHSFCPGLFDDVHQWSRKWLKLGYKFESEKSKTVMNRMMEKYELFTGPPPKTIYRSLGDHLPPSPISYWDIASKPHSMQPRIQKEFDPITGQRVYDEFSGCEWWEEADAYVPEIQQDRHYICPVSIFIDGSHLDNLGRMCVEPL
jgi:hypothetical protein